MKISNFNEFKLKKANYKSVFGGTVTDDGGPGSGGTWYKTYAKSDTEKGGSYWQDYLD